MTAREISRGATQGAALAIIIGVFDSFGLTIAAPLIGLSLLLIAAIAHLAVKTRRGN